MSGTKRIGSALISVHDKDGLEPIVHELHRLGVALYSTGGTQRFIEELGVPVVPVEDLTGYPSILGGRVKTLHPKVFGGILGRRGLADDVAQLETYAIPPIDLVVVDLYPFEATVAAGSSEQAIIEQIDIGGISLVRAGAKNHADVVIIAARAQYGDLLRILREQGGSTDLAERRRLAGLAFGVSSRYDRAIHSWFTGEQADGALPEGQPAHPLRYGENPHQSAGFHGDLQGLFRQLQGKEISYNNLLDLDAALELIDDMATLPGVPFAVLKHNNACGAAVRPTVKEAWEAALAGDPVSAFGGVLISTATIDKATAEAIDGIFFEIICAPGYAPQAVEVLGRKKNRIILERRGGGRLARKWRSALNGLLVQAPDRSVEGPDAMRTVTKRAPTAAELQDLVFANIVVKHTKSNAIVLAKGLQLLASGTGQTSRVDALEQAIAKARKFGPDAHRNDLQGAVMASDAFFPFPDCVTIAGSAGITAVVQPGGSIKDQDSVDACDERGMAMCITGNRHFKH